MKLKQLNEKVNAPRTLDVAYEIVTPESAEQGDYAETGWEERGVSMEPDEFDVEDEITAVDKVVDYISEYGGVEPSASQFHPGVWYTTIDSEQGSAFFEQGEEKRYSFHLKNFSEGEERKVYDRLTRKK